MSQNLDSKQGENQPDTLLQSWQQNDDILPSQLSGDQNAQKFIQLAREPPSSNSFLTVITMVKTVVGAGILSLPYTLNKLGYVFAIFLFVFALIVNQFTSVLLLKSKNLCHHSNYISICYSTFKSKIFQCYVSTTLLLTTMGVCLLQLLIVKQSFRKILTETSLSQQALSSFYTQQWFMVVIAAFFLAPLTTVIKIQKLKFFALIGVSGICLFILILIIIWIEKVPNQQFCHLNAFPEDWGQAMSMIPYIMFVYGYQTNFYPLFKGLRNGNDKRMSRVSLFGLIMCCSLYLLVGGIGLMIYSCSRNQISANFLKTIKKEDVDFSLYVLVNCGFLLSVFFSFPVIFFTARNNFIALIKMAISRKNLVQIIREPNPVQQDNSLLSVEDHNQNIPPKKRYFYIQTLLLFSIIIGIAIAVTSIESVFNIVGAISANSISYIYPTLFYIALIYRNNKPRTYRYYIAITVFVIAIPIGVASIVLQYV